MDFFHFFNNTMLIDCNIFMIIALYMESNNKSVN